MPPHHSDQSATADLVRRAPITATTFGLAIVVTLYFWNGQDPELVTMSPLAFTTEPWRLLTSTLAHGNFIHIFFNLYWMKMLGPVFEERLHPLLVIAIFVTIAAGSGAAQYAVGIGGVGLSGVVYGLLGFLWYANTRADAFRGLLPSSTIKLMVGWFFLCIIATRMGTLNVANVAHGVGGIMGWVAGWVVLSPTTTRPLKTLAYYAMLGLFLLSGSVWRMPFLERFGDERYFEAVRAMEGFEDPASFQADRNVLEEELEGQDWQAIQELATTLILRYDRPIDPPKAIARLFYLRAFANMRLGHHEQAIEDVSRAIEINPGEPGTAEIADHYRKIFGE